MRKLILMLILFSNVCYADSYMCVAINPCDSDYNLKHEYFNTECQTDYMNHCLGQKVYHLQRELSTSTSNESFYLAKIERQRRYIKRILKSKRRILRQYNSLRRLCR